MKSSDEIPIRRILRTFLASPGDVANEREIVNNVVAELNLVWGEFLGVQLELVRWETHAFPGVSGYPQSVINEQIGAYQIFLGIFCSRFGTPTPAADSGTEEEFNRAFELHVRTNGRVAIMLYFKSAPPPNGSETKQLRALSEFRRNVATKGVLYWTFPDEGHFASLVRLHLSRQLQSWYRRAATGEMLATPLASAAAELDREVSATRIKKSFEAVGDELVLTLHHFFDGLTNLETRLRAYHAQVFNRHVGSALKRSILFNLSRDFRELSLISQLTASKFRPLFGQIMEELSQGAALLVDDPIALFLWRKIIGASIRNLDEAISKANTMLENLIENVNLSRGLDRTLTRTAESTSLAVRGLKSEFEYAQHLVREAIEHYEIAATPSESDQ